MVYDRWETGDDNVPAGRLSTVWFSLDLLSWETVGEEGDVGVYHINAHEIP